MGAMFHVKQSCVRGRSSVDQQPNVSRETSQSSQRYLQAAPVLSTIVPCLTQIASANCWNRMT